MNCKVNFEKANFDKVICYHSGLIDDQLHFGKSSLEVAGENGLYRFEIDWALFGIFPRSSPLNTGKTPTMGFLQSGRGLTAAVKELTQFSQGRKSRHFGKMLPPNGGR